jgi:hypothetical protein
VPATKESIKHPGDHRATSHRNTLHPAVYRKSGITYLDSVLPERVRRSYKRNNEANTAIVCKY